MAIPPQMARNDALDILLDMESRNTDGFGFTYTYNGKFILNKTALSLSECLKRKKSSFNIWNNFPDKRKGWLILHMRAATHGDVCAKNSHPFIAGNTAWVHNGVFRECEIVQAAMGKDIKLQSDTDSEVALHLYNKVGPKRFVNLVGGSSVYLALKKDGSLWAMKTAYGADLKIAKLSKNSKIHFLASTLPYDSPFPHEEADDGWYYFGQRGNLLDHAEKKDNTGHSSFKKPSISRPITNHTDYGPSDYRESEEYYLEFLREKREKESARMAQHLRSQMPLSHSPADVEMPLAGFHE